MTALTIAGLRKNYGSVAAVDGIDLEIPKGCVFGLLGPNGAGKSTTFKCVLGLIRASAGRVLFAGAPFSPAALERTAYVPERSVLYDWMSVREHIGYMKNSFTGFDPERARELLAQFGVGDESKKVRALSKGMRTAVAVALAFARRVDLLLLDEPTSGLDPVNQRSVLNLIINEAAQGTTVVFSSHQIGQVERAADRIAVMQRGRIVLEGIVDDLKAGRKIVEGILPSDDFSVNGLASDARIGRLERNGRILRAFVTEQPDDVAAHMSALGAQGLRVVDLSLEDIFLDAVAPKVTTASVVEEV